MWELGFAGGNNMVIGDIKPKADVGGAITLRKALSNTFSLRGGWFGGYSQGYPNAPQRQTQPAVRSFQNWKHSVALDLITSLNPNSHYRGNPKTNIYVLAGLDLIATKVFYAAAGGQQIDKAYNVFYGAGFPSNQTGTFTTFGGAKINGRKGWTLLPGGSAGAGIAFKLSPKVNIGLEQRFTFVNYDYLDGYKAPNSRNFDMYSFSSARLNLNLGSSAKRVQPLWWLNANNFVYNEINRPQHMKIPTPVLPDADGDGVTDQFDMEPNTPSGAPVDARGVAKDTDADGVPDYKDKELLTPQKCFPVDADGVGNCPEPACCTELRARIDSGLIGAACNIGNLPSIQFKAGRATLSSDAQTMLASAAAQIKATPDCRVRVVGHGASDKRAQQLSWDRVNAVIRYLVEKQGISEDRFIFSYGEEGDVNTVDLTGTKETGPNSVPAPHPNLKGRK
jgi:outer membrane protein OmpA-like peptidoglycan-associated protein